MIMCMTSPSGRTPFRTKILAGVLAGSTLLGAAVVSPEIAQAQEAPAQDEPVEEERIPLQPGDIISFYAEATDRSQTIRTDMFFIQVQPFNRRYSQSQLSGGGGGGMQGGQQDEISSRQRQIIVSA